MDKEARAEMPAERHPQYVSVKVFYQALLLVTFAASILTVVVYDRYFTVKIASFDLPGYWTQLREARMAGKITQEQSDRLMDGVKQQIDSLPPNYVVISGDAILGNATRVKRLIAAAP